MAKLLGNIKVLHVLLRKRKNNTNENYSFRKDRTT